MKKLYLALLIVFGLVALTLQPALANHHYSGCPMGQAAHIGGFYTNDMWVAYSVWYEHGYHQQWDYFEAAWKYGQHTMPFGSTLGVPWNATVQNVDVFTNGWHQVGHRCGD